MIKAWEIEDGMIKTPCRLFQQEHPSNQLDTITKLRNSYGYIPDLDTISISQYQKQRDTFTLACV